MVKGYRFYLLIFMIVSYQAHTVLIISIPKCGTNLLIKCVKLIREVYTKEVQEKFIQNKTFQTTLNHIRPDNQIYAPHAFPTELLFSIVKKYQLKPLFIYRDPRAQVVSLAYHFKRFHSNIPEIFSSEISELVGKIIEDSVFLYKIWREAPELVGKTVSDLYNLYLPWIEHPAIYVTTFEKLIGPHGGGKGDDQLKEIINISKHIGMPISIDQARDVAKNLF